MFCILASSIYIFNDLMDIKEDRKHPVKKYRPLASGKLKINTAIFLLISLSLLSLGCAYFLNHELFFVFIFTFY